MRPRTSVSRESHWGHVAASLSNSSGTGFASSWTGLYLRGTTSPPADPGQAVGGLASGCQLSEKMIAILPYFPSRGVGSGAWRIGLVARRNAGYWSMRSERSLKRTTASEIVSSR
jgi:hypothetical protein